MRREVYLARAAIARVDRAQQALEQAREQRALRVLALSEKMGATRARDELDYSRARFFQLLEEGRRIRRRREANGLTLDP